MLLQSTAGVSCSDSLQSDCWKRCILNICRSHAKACVPFQEALTGEVVRLEDGVLDQHIACSPGYNVIRKRAGRPKRYPRQVGPSRCLLCRLSSFFYGHRKSTEAVTSATAVRDQAAGVLVCWPPSCRFLVTRSGSTPEVLLRPRACQRQGAAATASPTHETAIMQLCTDNLVT